MAKQPQDSARTVNSGKQLDVSLSTAYENLLHNHNKIKILYELSLALSSIHELTPFLQLVTCTIRENLDVDGFALIRFQPDGGELTPLCVHSLDINVDDATLVDDVPVLAKLMRKRKLQRVADLADSRCAELRSLLNVETGEFIGAPLRCDREKRPVGAFLLYRKRSHEIDPAELELIEEMSGLLGNALDTISLYQHTKHLSIRDELTGVFNRRYFNQRYERELQRAKRYRRSLAIIMLDIDHFKIYNDLNGHLLGDMVLRSVAQNLEKVLRKADFVARFGGEEFVIMLPEISKKQALQAAEKLRKMIEQLEFPNETSQPRGKLTISQGVAVYPEDSQDPQMLLKYADDALYLAKTMGRNCVAWHGMKKPRSSGKADRRRPRAEPAGIPTQRPAQSTNVTHT